MVIAYGSRAHARRAGVLAWLALLLGTAGCDHEAAVVQQPRVGGFHPCGNGTLDPGEACDDGLANGDDRECTLQCELNDCELDEHGVCEPESPAADVDLYPCVLDPSRHTPCGIGLSPSAG